METGKLSKDFEFEHDFAHHYLTLHNHSFRIRPAFNLIRSSFLKSTLVLSSKISCFSPERFE